MMQLAVSFPTVTLPQNRHSTFQTEVHPHGRFDDRNLPRDSSASKHRVLLHVGDPHLPEDGDDVPLNEFGHSLHDKALDDGHVSIPNTSASSYRTAPPSFSNSGLSQRSGGSFGTVSEIVARES